MPARSCTCSSSPTLRFLTGQSDSQAAGDQDTVTAPSAAHQAAPAPTKTLPSRPWDKPQRSPANAEAPFPEPHSAQAGLAAVHYGAGGLALMEQAKAVEPPSWEPPAPYLPYGIVMVHSTVRLQFDGMSHSRTSRSPPATATPRPGAQHHRLGMPGVHVVPTDVTASRAPRVDALLRGGSTPDCPSPTNLDAADTHPATTLRPHHLPHY